MKLIVLILIAVVLFLLISTPTKVVDTEKIYKECPIVEENSKSIIKAIEDKTSYDNPTDYYMAPIVAATAIANSQDAVEDNEIYNVNRYINLNESVNRYNETVHREVEKNQNVPRVEEVINQRNYHRGKIRHTPIPPPAPIPTVIKNIPIAKKLKIKVKSSAQNVHDNNANDTLADRYKYLKQKRYPHTPGLQKFVSDCDNGDAIWKSIYNGADKLAKFDNDSELDVWNTVWSHIKESKSNNKNLMDSFRDSINACTENGIPVCSTGRVTRALDCLTLIDKDPILSQPVLTDDILRKEIYDKANDILQDELKNESESFRKKYDDGEECVDFDNRVKKRIKYEIIKLYPKYTGKAEKYIDEACNAL